VSDFVPKVRSVVKPSPYWVPIVLPNSKDRAAKKSMNSLLLMGV
jgi:hypothetical protein